MQALEEVQSELDALSSGCSAINTALAADRSSSADLLSESDKLQHELATSQKRSTLVQSFFKQYQLSAVETSALQVCVIAVVLVAVLAKSAACCLLRVPPALFKTCPAPDFCERNVCVPNVCVLQEADISDPFFDALERVGSIHRSCRNLLSSHHHRAGLELMDAMSAYQETAYERLCR